MSALGSIHGRFQPFHNGHLRYAVEVLDRVDFLYVGLARSLTETGPIDGSLPHRLDPQANPFTYFERVEMIRAALLSVGVDAERFVIGPFPIENPSRLKEFCPPKFTAFTTVVEDWNETKIHLLEGLGYAVEIAKHGAWEAHNISSGTNIRHLIRTGGGWAAFVPEPVAELIRVRLALAPL